MTHADGPGPIPPRAAVPRRVWGAVVLLMLVGMFNVVDRMLPSILIEPIKHDLQLSDTAIGLINGFGFLVVYAVVGIPIARLTDRGRYGLVIAVCLGLWSVMTAVGGLAQTGVQLALARMGVALGEAGSSPAAHAFISRNFAPDRRSAPLALLTLSVPFAIILSLVVGGLLGQALGWRMTFAAIGGAGLLLAPAVLFVLGAGRHGGAGPVPHPARIAAAPAGRLLNGSVLFILAGSACIGIGGYALTAFGPAYLMRAHGYSLTQVGVEYGLLVGGIGVTSLIVTGLFADRLAARDPRWLLWSVAVLIVLVTPFSIMGFLARDPAWALVGAAIANITATAYAAPVISALHRLVPAQRRATASAVMLFATALAGGSGPLAVGMASDALTPTIGARALGLGLLLVPAIHLLAAACYAGATWRFHAHARD